MYSRLCLSSITSPNSVQKFSLLWLLVYSCWYRHPRWGRLSSMKQQVAKICNRRWNASFLSPRSQLPDHSGFSRRQRVASSGQISQLYEGDCRGVQSGGGRRSEGTQKAAFNGKLQLQSPVRGRELAARRRSIGKGHERGRDDAPLQQGPVGGARHEVAVRDPEAQRRHGPPVPPVAPPSRPRRRGQA